MYKDEYKAYKHFHEVELPRTCRWTALPTFNSIGQMRPNLNKRVLSNLWSNETTPGTGKLPSRVFRRLPGLQKVC